MVLRRQRHLVGVLERGVYHWSDSAMNAHRAQVALVSDASNVFLPGSNAASPLALAQRAEDGPGSLDKVAAARRLAIGRGIGAALVLLLLVVPMDVVRNRLRLALGSAPHLHRRFRLAAAFAGEGGGGGAGFSRHHHCN